MAEIYHLNCVSIVSPFNDNVCGHCLLLHENGKLVLVDTGIGLLDVLQPQERIGQQLIERVGYRFDEKQTAIRQLEQLGFKPEQESDCIISHFDNDHIGGLPDFPVATVHAGSEEYEQFASGHPRYLQLPLAHQPRVKTYAGSDLDWFGFEARKVEVALNTAIYLIPLFGHTAGHCGIAVQSGDRWLFYIADAYYMKAELYDEAHPVHELARAAADNNEQRLATLEKIRQLAKEHPEIAIFSYHDSEELNAFLD